MEFDALLLQQFTTIGNVFINRNLIFEDRVINASINVLATALLGILLNFLIEIAFKDGYMKYKKRLVDWWTPPTLDPLDFDPNTCFPKKGSDSDFMYSLRLPENIIGYLRLWFYTSHVNKDYSKYANQCCTNVQSYNKLLELYNGKKQHISVYDIDILNMKTFPIWKGRYGIVFMKDHSWLSYLYSDNILSLREFEKHLHNFKEEISKKNVHISSTNNGLWSFVKKDNLFIIELMGKIEQKHTFDYLHFHQKQEFLPLLTKFKEGTLYPRHIPMENKMGILLHGPPGTGKTRFIAATANYLDRGVAVINFVKVKTCSDFDSIIKQVLEKNLILVLDEIDTMKGVLTREVEVVSKGGEGGSDPIMNPYMMMLISKEKESSSLMADEMKRMTYERDDVLTLGHILSKLDGLESCKDLLIIATTNHPERIDPALTRPGRFGFQLRLGKCTRQMLHDILHMIFPDTSVYDIEKAVKGLKEHYYTPATIIQECIANITFEKAVEVLEKM